MLAGDLNALLKIVGKICNGISLTQLHRCVEIGPEEIRAVSEYGNISITVSPTGLTEPCLVVWQFLSAVASSLPSAAEISLTKDGDQVKWKCGKAKGHWAIIHQDLAIPVIQHTNFPWTPPTYFPNALILASSACQAASVSVGLFGVVINPVGENIQIMSSNQISLAVTTVPGNSWTAGQISMRPPIPTVLAALLTACPDAKLDITPEGIFVFGGWLNAHLPLSAPLEHDIVEIAGRFTTSNQILKMNAAAVKNFLMRARQMGDKHLVFAVGLQITDGNLVLEHKGISTSSEEYFLAEGIDATINYNSVKLPGDMLLVPLGSAEEVVLDYLPEQRIILRGKNPDFLYLVSGEDTQE